MKIIVASFSKTGTKSLAAALRHLGYKVYDNFEHFGYHEKQWMEIFQTGGSPDIFKQMYQDVDVVVDIPAFYFWDDIHQAFPDAKIVLCVRDEDSWMKSYAKEIASIKSSRLFSMILLFSPTGRRFLRYLVLGEAPVVLGLSPSSPVGNVNERVLRKKYRQHNLYVLQNAPKDKLLEYNIKEGWKPLCDFLEHDVPDVPFPRKNVGGQMLALAMKENLFMKRMVNETMISMCVLLALTLTGGYFAYKKRLSPYRFMQFLQTLSKKG